MADIGITSETRDNLVTSTKKLITGKVYTTATALTRGQVLKLTGTTLSAALTLETATTICLADVATGAVSYMVEGSVLESELNYNTGSATEFREQLRSVGIITEG